MPLGSPLFDLVLVGVGPRPRAATFVVPIPATTGSVPVTTAQAGPLGRIGFDIVLSRRIVEIGALAPARTPYAAPTWTAYPAPAGAPTIFGGAFIDVLFTMPDVVPRAPLPDPSSSGLSSSSEFDPCADYTRPLATAIVEDLDEAPDDQLATAIVVELCNEVVLPP